MAEHETIADIIAEMRIFKCRNLQTGELELCNAIANYFADRLDVAIAREREITDAKIADLQSRVKLWTDRSAELVKKCDEHYANAHKSERGDCAKLREAVKDAYDKLLLWNYTDGDTARMALGVMNKLDAALAEPPRNCDRFASAEEAWDAYDAWVESYREKGETEPLNEFGWLFAPATEKEGGNDADK